MILTKYSGNWIINNEPYSLIEGVTIVSYRDDATIEEFDTVEAMNSAYLQQYPEPS